MPLKHFMATLHLDEQELQSRRAFFEITDADLAKLAALRPLAEKHTGDIVESFYELLLNHRESRRFFPDEATVRRVKQSQREYFLGLFAGKCDLAYVEDRLRVGAAHEKIGLAPKWYIGAYRRYMQLMLERLAEELPGKAELRDSMRCIQKIVYFDMALAIDTYLAAHAETVRRHQQAIRELSTPVIRVYDGVLLLPLVGAIDSLRAGQVMESVLARVADDQARVIILDIAGVAVVDTKVADNLVKTTAAVRLLGAETILTGISAQVARTMVQLGVEFSAMHTRSRLAEGIELALDIVGKAIRPKEAK
ncbi:MAG: protoglobin domain-containing protein [Polyangiaceae bacterium]|jgi:rsbT co-antagonist protein RsbR